MLFNTKFRRWYTLFLFLVVAIIWAMTFWSYSKLFAVLSFIAITAVNLLAFFAVKGSDN